METVNTLYAEEVWLVFLDKVRQLRWPIQDPASDDPTLGREERLARVRIARDQIRARMEVLAALLDVPEGVPPEAFHASVRVNGLAKSARFYAWLLGIQVSS